MNDATAAAVRYQAMFLRNFANAQFAGFAGPKSPRESYHALRESYAAGTISLGEFESQVVGLLRRGL